MKADGSDKTLHSGLALTESHGPHGGHLWHLRVRDLPASSGSYPPRGYEQSPGPVRRELFALRDDGAAEVQLTNDPDVEIWFYEWGDDDSFVTFLAFEWDASGDVRSAIFRAPVAFDAQGLPALSAAPAPEVTTDVGEMATEIYFLFEGFDWSPDGSRLAFSSHAAGYGDYTLYVKTFGVADTRVLGPGSGPDWSPLGDRIAYSKAEFVGSGQVLGGAIWTIRPDGTDALQVAKPTRTRGYGKPRWSPDASHLALGITSETKTGYVYDVGRVPASGGSVVSLTTDVAIDCSLWSWR